MRNKLNYNYHRQSQFILQKEISDSARSEKIRRNKNTALQKQHDQYHKIIQK
jgi:hypothetical protein